MSEETSDGAPDRKPVDESTEKVQKPAQSGPTFIESPDPLSGIRKATGDAWKRTEGKTVSMRVYIGSVIGVIIIMMLARCGG